MDAGDLLEGERPELPEPWRKVLGQRWRGLLLVVGAPDTGKSTLSRLLYAGLSRAGIRAALLDGDPGQGSLGPPATMSLQLPHPGVPEGRVRIWRRFVGSTSPRGHMLPLLVGAARLREVAVQAGAGVVIYDTSGLVDPDQGGVRLKWAKMDLLQPTAVLALQRDRELEPILAPVRRLYADRLWELPVASAARRRDMAVRRTHRAVRFGRYFRQAEEVRVAWSDFAVIPAAAFSRHALVGLEDAGGFLIGLGIVLRVEKETQAVTFLTPVRSWEQVRRLHVGDLWVDPWTFQDGRISAAGR